MARSMPPCAFWPLTITAGVNDYIDFTISGGSEMSARIAAGVYLSIASLLTACETAIGDRAQVLAGVNDKIDFTVFSVPYVATVPAGLYTASELGAAAAAAMTSVASPTYAFEGGASTGEQVGIASATGFEFSMQFASGPNSATTAATVMGFPKSDTATGPSFSAPASPPAYMAVSFSVSSGGAVTFSVTGGATASLLFSTGTHADLSARDVLGFGAMDTASGTSATAANQHQNGWYPEIPCTFDSREEYERTAAGTVSLSGKTKSLTFGSAREQRRVSFAWLPEWKTKIAREGTHTNEALERLWLQAGKFRWWPDATVEGTYIDAVLDPKELAQFKPGRDDRLQLYSYDLRMWKYVA